MVTALQVTHSNNFPQLWKILTWSAIWVAKGTNVHFITILIRKRIVTYIDVLIHNLSLNFLGGDIEPHFISYPNIYNQRVVPLNPHIANGKLSIKIQEIDIIYMCSISSLRNKILLE